MFYLYKWKNLLVDSPDESVRNEWLYNYGAFARKNGVWFPCRVIKKNTIGAPAAIMVIPIATVNLEIYPRGEIFVETCEYFYCVFPDGMSIKAYIQRDLEVERLTNNRLVAAIKRSLNTELLHAPRRLTREVKRAANRDNKEESYVINSDNANEIGVIELPRTADILEKLWNSKDWARQELSQLLGITYNPSQGKKERMISSELLGDRDLTIMNRERLTSRLITSAEKYGEYVCHISSEIDFIDRGLAYGNERGIDKNGGNEKI